MKKSHRVNRAKAVREAVEMPIAHKQDKTEQNTIESVKRERQSLRQKQNVGHRMSV